MKVDERIREALELDRLDVPPSLHVVEVEAEDYVDTSGDDALRVLVTLDEDTDEFAFKGEDIIRLKSSIRQNLLDRGIEVFAYIRFAKRSELDEIED